MSEPASLHYLPYHRLDGRPNIVVDGSPARGTTLTLTHWPRQPAPQGLARDLSAQMAFAYLDAGARLHGPATAVSNNHFDQDGLVSIFALTHPHEALARRDLLEDLAASGDFATYKDRSAARLSAAVAAYADESRSPLRLEGDPSERAAQLYTELLGLLPELCDHPERVRPLWADDDDALARSERLVATGAITLSERPDVDLAVFDVPAGLRLAEAYRFAHLRYPGPHPTALANATGRFAVLVRHGGQYRFYYRYESWVAYRSSRPRPRRDLRPLAEELSALEPGSVTWSAQPSGALEPVLAPVEGRPSGIDPHALLDAIVLHLTRAPADWDPYRAEMTAD